MNDDLLAQIQINKNSAIPIYRQLEEQVEQSIKDGTWQPGSALPSETALAARFRISVMTVRQAMSHLVNKGLIYREKGRGTFIAPLPLLHPSSGWKASRKICRRGASRLRRKCWRLKSAPRLKLLRFN